MNKNFVSLSRYPGTTGKTYYTKFFQKYNLDYTYEPIGTDNLDKSLNDVLDKNVSGISISMPFKKDIISYLDIIDQSVSEYDLCNTVVVQDKKLIGYNADLHGALNIIKYINKNDSIAILGNGNIGRMFQKLLFDYNVITYSRSLKNWGQRTSDVDVIINCTLLGTSTSESPYEKLPNCNLVIDLALKENQLMKQCQNSSTKYLSGLEFYKYQFLKQFEIYTGIEIDDKGFDTI